MAYNVQKARDSGIPDEQIAAYLQKSGRSTDEIKQLMGGGGGFKFPTQGASEFAGMLGGQALGGAMGAPGGPPGMAAGRLLGGTAGNVLGTAAAPMIPEVLKSLGNTGQMLAGRMPTNKVNMPEMASGKELVQSAKEGAQASTFAEALPMAFRGGGMLRKAVSKDSGTLKGIAGLVEGLTGQDAQEYINLVDKPRAILYRWMGGYKGASRAWNEFTDLLEKRQIPKEAVEFGYRETPASVKNHVFDLMDMAKATKDKIMAQIPTAHVIKMMRATQEVIGNPETTRGFGELKGFRQKLVGELAKRDDEIAKSWQQVANSQLSKSFHGTGFGLVAKAGKDKAAGFKLFYELRRMLPVLVGAGLGASGHPEAGLGLGALFSPQMMGLPFAAGGLATKAMQSPATVASGVKLLQKMRKE